MKIIHSNMKTGIVKIEVENLDDLWYLSNIVSRGDLVKAKTERRIKGKDDIERSKSERVTINLTILVERGDFKLEDDTFRITGTIENGPEDLVAIGTYHTINVGKGTIISIIKKRWSHFEIDRLKEAERSAARPKILIAVIDEGEATIGLVRESKIEYYDISKTIGGKYDTKGRQQRKDDFYRDTADVISNMLDKENVSAIIIAGAGFEKEGFYRFIAEKYPRIHKISVMENTGSQGRCGVGEVMKKGTAKKVYEEINAAREIRLVNGLLEEIGKNSGLAAYGYKDVSNAAGAGAIEKLMVCDDLFMKERDRVDALMKNVKSSRGSVNIINHDSEAGKQLESIGGIAGILRYRID